MSQLTQERLREVLNYNPETGVFTWRIAAGRGGRFKPGTVAGGNSRGDWRIELDKRAYRAPVLAWLYIHGVVIKDVFHVNCNRHDNRLCNLVVLAPAQKGVGLTAERLRQLLSYDPETGIFRWASPQYGALVGKTAGYKADRDDRVSIRVDGKLYWAHRLAWLHTTGAWPPHGIDHKDGDPGNNRLLNLRPATQAENAQNRQRATCTSKSGILGVCWATQRSVWLATIKKDGKTKRMQFDCLLDAVAARLRAERELFPFSTRKGVV